MGCTLSKEDVSAKLRPLSCVSKGTPAKQLDACHLMCLFGSCAAHNCRGLLWELIMGIGDECLESAQSCRIKAPSLSTLTVGVNRKLGALHVHVRAAACLLCCRTLRLGRKQNVCAHNSSHSNRIAWLVSVVHVQALSFSAEAMQRRALISSRAQIWAISLPTNLQLKTQESMTRNV